MRKVFIFIPAIGAMAGISIFAWVLFFYNKSESNNGHPVVDAYIKNCTAINLKINNYNNTSPDIKGNARLLGTAVFFSNQTVFYDDNYKKYFVIEFIGESASSAYIYSEFIGEIDKGEHLKALVNKAELADHSYGTPQKPVPIFSFNRDDVQYHKTYMAFLSSDGTYPDNHVKLAKDYRGAIGVYLTHVKSKADFEKMFGKAGKMH